MNDTGLMDLGKCVSPRRAGNSDGTFAEVPCNGDLCLRGDEVSCVECGAVQEGHPLMEQARAARERLASLPPEPEFKLGPLMNVPSWGDRINRLEEGRKADRREIAELRTEIAALWAKVEGGVVGGQGTGQAAPVGPDARKRK